MGKTSVFVILIHKIENTQYRGLQKRGPTFFFFLFLNFQIFYPSNLLIANFDRKLTKRNLISEIQKFKRNYLKGC